MERPHKIGLGALLACTTPIWSGGTMGYEMTMPGAQCVVENPAKHGDKARFTNGVIKNASGGKINVVCPVAVPGTAESLSVALNIVNPTPQRRTYSCQLQEFAPNTLRVQSLSTGSRSITGDSYVNAKMSMDFKRDDSRIAIKCALPPQSALQSINFTFSGEDAGGINPPTTLSNIKACITSPTGSQSGPVEFKNGAIIANNRGTKFYSNYTVTLYLTESGEWYMAQGGFKKVEMTQEPETCFQPELYEVVDKYPYAADIRIELSNGYTYVQDSPELCKNILKGHLVDANHSSLLSINTMESCDVDLVE